MSSYERSTLRWAKTAVIISCLAAFFVCAQWFEMHSGGKDTHNLALASLAANRAWVAPDRMQLGTALENGFPVHYNIRIANPGREPAIGLIWNIKPLGVPYVPFSEAPSDLPKVGPSLMCEGLEPKPNEGVALYPDGNTNFWLPLTIDDTQVNRQLIDAVLKRNQSLLIEGCFAYITGGEAHTSSFSYFLRDEPGKPSFVVDSSGKVVSSWGFNLNLNGNSAN